LDQTKVSEAAETLLAELRSIVGRRNLIIDDGRLRSYVSGYRVGFGTAAAAVRPQNLVELWRIIQACAAADTIIIMQAANTGLTGGSTPDGDDYDRPVIVVNAMAIDAIHVLDEGRQVICLPGARLNELQIKLAHFGREPHSLIGSSCIGASVIGGICNNSGGALIRRGPAYTEFALYAKFESDGSIHLVNHLGVSIEGDPESILERIERGDFALENVTEARRRGSDTNYQQHVRDVDAATPARFNSDPRCLFEASGSAGKLIVFAVRLDTFPTDDKTVTFYIGSNDPDDLTCVRRTILTQFDVLPISAEYLHRDAFNVAEQYGKDTFLIIRWLGTQRLPKLLGIKARIDTMVRKLGFAEAFCDRFLQHMSRLWPSHLPLRMRAWRNRYEHHLLLKVAGSEVARTRDILAERFTSARGDFFECTPGEADMAFLHRFVTAGAAVRYRLVHRHDVEDIVALDIALPRNTSDWVEKLPDDIERRILHKIYYGHFFCHVFHQDYILKKGQDSVACEHAMWRLLDARGAEYPAEHNVGHLYRAKPALKAFFRELDPCNALNPGIGMTSKKKWWGTRSNGRRQT
jgi:D-lactate dehydrogenase